MEEIYGKKISQGKTFYYVRWKGRSEAENSWLASEEIPNLDALLAFDRTEDSSSIIKRKGSFSRDDEVKKVAQIVWNEEANEAMGEVEWKSSHLYNAIYPLKVLHDMCPKEMCEMYHSLLKFTYTP